jgi:VanZ family protein
MQESRSGASAVRRGVAWAFIVLYAALIAYMSLRRFGNSPFDRAIDHVGRAYLHLPAYAGLAGLLGVMLRTKTSLFRQMGWAFLIAAGYGWALEVAQIAAPTRSFNLCGLLFDAAGAAAGACMALGYAAWRRKRGAAAVARRAS